MSEPYCNQMILYSTLNALLHYFFAIKLFIGALARFIHLPADELVLLVLASSLFAHSCSSTFSSNQFLEGSSTEVVATKADDHYAIIVTKGHSLGIYCLLENEDIFPEHSIVQYYTHSLAHTQQADDSDFFMALVPRLFFSAVYTIQIYGTHLTHFPYSTNHNQ